MKKFFTFAFAILMIFLAVPAYSETAYLKDLLINGNAEDGINGWITPDGLWGADNEIEPKEGEHFFWPCNGGCEYTYMYQDVSLVGYNAGDWVILRAWLCNYDQSPNDQATIEIAFLNAKGNVITRHTREQRNPEWLQQSIFAKIPAGTATARVKLIATRFVGNDNDAYFDDVSFIASDEEYSMVYITGEKDKANKGDKIQLVATNGKSKNPLDYEWSTSYSSIATVDEEGIVTFVNDGELTVYAKDKKTGVVGVYRFNSDIPNIVPPYSEASVWATGFLDNADDYNLIPECLKSADMKKPITRYEFAALGVKLYEAMSGKSATAAEVNPFTDTKNAEILKAYNLKITSGTSATTFEPDVLIPREQVAVMLSNTVKAVYPEIKIDGTDVSAFDDDENISSWAKKSVYFMVKNNIISGIGNNKFAPKNTTDAEKASGYANATREQALIISVKSFENLGE